MIGIMALASIGLGQIGGGAAMYRNGGSGHGTALSNERDKRNLKNFEIPQDGSTYIEASVLLNRTADEYMAMFAISEDGETIEIARHKTDDILAAFTAKLRLLGAAAKDTYIDYVSQNRIYGYQVDGDLAKEVVVGFEVKKTISIHYVKASMLDSMIEAAAAAGIYDLVKVDYVVKDLPSIESQLLATATRIVKQRLADRRMLLGSKLTAVPQIVAEKYASYYPSDMYSSYVAQESQDMVNFRQNLVVQNALKPRTGYFDPLGGDGFDEVINPIITEPVVQFTLYLKLKYKEAPAAKAAR